MTALSHLGGDRHQRLTKPQGASLAPCDWQELLEQDKHGSKSGFGKLLAFCKGVPTPVGGNSAN
jgi:hypothetical protein